MELKEFVSQALIQIIDGISDAQNYAKDKGALIAPGGQTRRVGIDFLTLRHDIEFDIAITTSDNVSGKVGAGLFVAGFTIGSQGTGESSNQTFSRIKFVVPVTYTHQP